MTIDPSPRDRSAAIAGDPGSSRALEALAAAGMGVWDWNLLTGELVWDDQIARLHGFEPEDFDGTLATFLSRIHPDDEHAVEAAIQEALGRGGEFRTEFRVVRPDGTTAWIQGRGTVILDAAGAPLRMVGIGSDTTELLSSRDQVGGTLEHIIDGVLLVDLDWRIVLANANAERIVQRSAVEVVGQNLWEVRPDVVGTEFWDRCHEAMRAQEVQTFEAYYGPLEGWFEVRAYPSPTVLTLYFQNVDERRAAAEVQEALVTRLEEALDRQNQTQSVVVALADALSVVDVAAAVVSPAIRVLGTMFAGVALLTEDGAAVRFVTLAPFPAETVAEWEAITLDVPSALTDCVRLRRPLYHSSRAELLATYPLAATVEMAENHAFANVPLLVRGRVLGALSMSWAEPRDFSDQDRNFVRMLAAQCAQAIERAQLFSRQRDVANTLQQAMLPDDLPKVEGVDVSACYLPATTDLTVGGDWYDAFTLSDGRLAFAVGDVSGHGVQAAAVMGQIRNALRAYIAEGHSPAVALTKLDELVERDGHGLFATAIAAVYDPVSGDLVWSNAGHPPLVLRTPTTARLLEGHVGAPIGVGGPQGHRDERLTVQVGEQLVGYTDGLVERRQEDLGVGLERLVAAVVDAAVPITAGDWCESLVDVVLGSATREDDICVLVLQRT